LKFFIFFIFLFLIFQNHLKNNISYYKKKFQNLVVDPSKLYHHESKIRSAEKNSCFTILLCLQLSKLEAYLTCRYSSKFPQSCWETQA